MLTLIITQQFPVIFESFYNEIRLIIYLLFFTLILLSLFNVQKTLPGITKGEHWHHKKNEKFVVVSGHGVIRFRDYFSDEVIEYEVSGDKFEVLDIPTGYTHSIVNTGDADMVTIMWVNEIFDPNHPDTFFLEV